MRLIRPLRRRAVGIGQFRLEVGTWQVVPLEAVHVRDACGGGCVGDGLLAFPIDRVAHIAAEGVPRAGEGLGILQFYLLLSPLAHKYLSSMRRLAKDGRNRKTSAIF